MKCKLTLKEGIGIKAHIIPRCFYEIDCADKRPLKIISSNEGIYPQTSWIGIYDSNMVTKDGEAILQLLDDYACNLLIKNISFAKPAYDNEALQIDNYDYHKLKLFFLSLLWRASVSEHSFFKAILLNPQDEEEIRTALLKNDAGDPDFYSVNLCLFDKPANGVPTLSPEKCKFDGVNCYKFYLGQFVVVIKVDSKLQEESLRSFCMEKGKPLYIIKRQFEDSKERELMKIMAEQNR